MYIAVKSIFVGGKLHQPGAEVKLTKEEAEKLTGFVKPAGKKTSVKKAEPTKPSIPSTKKSEATASSKESEVS